ncbi:MAG TPA: hypothetical protein VMZ22_13310 [Acidimicrobiales bacterium]|nr:hypothetical protein [Acidimicrobiales bacterium]
MRPHRSQRGQVVPLLAAFVVFTGFVLMALAHLAGGAVDRAGAKRAADMAALAGAADASEASASSYARRNHASLQDYAAEKNEVTVEVYFGDARAVSRARRDGGGKAQRPGDPAPALRAALARAEQVLGHKPSVVKASGYVVTLTAASYDELAPRGDEVGLCGYGPNQLRVCGAT